MSSNQQEPPSQEMIEYLKMVNSSFQNSIIDSMRRHLLLACLPFSQNQSKLVIPEQEKIKYEEIQPQKQEIYSPEKREPSQYPIKYEEATKVEHPQQASIVWSKVDIAFIDGEQENKKMIHNDIPVRKNVENEGIYAKEIVEYLKTQTKIFDRNGLQYLNEKNEFITCGQISTIKNELIPQSALISDLGLEPRLTLRLTSHVKTKPPQQKKKMAVQAKIEQSDPKQVIVIDEEESGCQKSDNLFNVKAEPGQNSGQQYLGVQKKIKKEEIQQMPSPQQQMRENYKNLTIAQVIVMLKRWRFLHLKKQFSLNEAATKMNMLHTTLEDFQKSIREAFGLGYQFVSNLEQRFTVLKKFVSENKGKQMLNKSNLSIDYILEILTITGANRLNNLEFQNE